MSELKVQARECDSEQMVQSSEIRAAFTARLKKALADRGIAEWGAGSRLAKITGKTPKAASKWLNAESMPGRPAMIQIAEWLEVDVDWLEYGPATSPAGPRFSVTPTGDGETYKVSENSKPYPGANLSAIARLKAAWAVANEEERNRLAKEFLGAGNDLPMVMELFFRINDASKAGTLTREEVGAIGTLVRSKKGSTKG